MFSLQITLVLIHGTLQHTILLLLHPVSGIILNWNLYLNSILIGGLNSLLNSIILLLNSDFLIAEFFAYCLCLFYLSISLYISIYLFLKCPPRTLDKTQQEVHVMR